MLDEHDGDVELVADPADVVHELGRLGRVHTGGRLVEQKQLGVRGERTDDLEPALGAVRQRARRVVGIHAHVEEVEQLEGALVHLLLSLPVRGQAQDRGRRVLLDLVVQADLDVVLDGQRREQADVLEGAGHAGTARGGDVHACRVLAVEHDHAVRGVVDLGEQVEHRGLARAVGTDETGDLGLAHREVEVVDGLESAELDAQVTALEDGALVDVALGDDGVRGQGHHLGVLATLGRVALGGGHVTHRPRRPSRMQAPRSSPDA